MDWLGGWGKNFFCSCLGRSRSTPRPQIFLLKHLSSRKYANNTLGPFFVWDGMGAGCTDSETTNMYSALAQWGRKTGFVFWSLPDIAVLWALVLTDDKCRRDGPLVSKFLYAGFTFYLKNLTQHIRNAVTLA